nr:MAG TPA: transmembrane protein [Siphoviridae sp. ctRJB2]
MKVNNNSNGIGFVGALTIAFVVLKLMKIIDWSWWWVLSPLWISMLVVIVVIAVVFLFFLAEGS